MNPFLITDGYKTGHHMMYPEGTSLVYSNGTFRSNKYAPEGIREVVVFGSQMTMMEIHQMFEDHFFLTKYRDEHPHPDYKMTLRGEICQEICVEYSAYLNCQYDVSHIEALWDLGYLPIKVKSLPEGTTVPFGVPVFTIYNTIPEFYWLTNFLETILSNLLWKPMTSATIAHRYKRNLLKWALKTDKANVGFVDFQGHDFSMRGLDSVYATMSSGLGHATSFLGSDSLPVIHAARKYYGHEGPVVHSVNATEHSVMSAGKKDSELETFRYLLKKFPTGILSIVSDTWDLWTVLINYLPKLKEEILKRPADGLNKVVIRPDSGDPADIICGTIISLGTKDEWFELLKNKTNDNRTSEQKGVIELLWDEFGGTTNDQGYKVLHPCIGAIYGDSITLDRAEEICKRLAEKGFASTNVVLGIGSYTYQYNTRDTLGFAMKATYCEVGEEKRELFKDPITDDGTKKSAKGLLQVFKDKERAGSPLAVKNQVSWDEEAGGELKTIYEDGVFNSLVTLDEIRLKLNQKVENEIKKTDYISSNT